MTKTKGAFLKGPRFSNQSKLYFGHVNRVYVCQNVFAISQQIWIFTLRQIRVRSLSDICRYVQKIVKNAQFMLKQHFFRLLINKLEV